MIYAKAAMRSEGGGPLRPLATGRTVALPTGRIYKSVAWDGVGPNLVATTTSSSYYMSAYDANTGAWKSNHPAASAQNYDLDVVEGDILVLNTNTNTVQRLTGMTSATAKLAWQFGSLTVTNRITSDGLGMFMWSPNTIILYDMTGGTASANRSVVGDYTDVTGITTDKRGLIIMVGTTIYIYEGLDVTTPVRSFSLPTGTVNISHTGTNMLSITSAGVVTIHDNG